MRIPLAEPGSPYSIQRQSPWPAGSASSFNTVFSFFL